MTGNASTLCLLKGDNNSYYSKAHTTVVAHHAYEPQRDDELKFNAGDIIQVTDSSDPDWWIGKKDDGTSGFFPSNVGDGRTFLEEWQPFLYNLHIVCEPQARYSRRTQAR